VPVLEASAGKENVLLLNAITGAEDFSFFANEIPAFFFFLGGKPHEKARDEVAAHHTPDFYIEESSFKVGVRTLANLALDYMQRHASN
jgi:amidohydrolase